MTASAPTDPLAADKARLREELKRRRAALTAEQRADRDARIEARLAGIDALHEARTVFAFVSYASEVHTHGIIHRLLDAGKTVVVPSIVDRWTMVARRIERWSDLEPGKLGILAPARGAPHDGPVDVALTPGLGFTLAGARIGYGAGYYDKWFAAHPVKRRIALAYELQLVDELPLEPTDVPVDLIVTEARIIHTRPHAATSG